MTRQLARLLILALLCPMPAYAATLGEISAWCVPPDRGGQPKLCAGYLDSNLELLASPDLTDNGGRRICVPAHFDRDQIIRLMNDYLRKHPEARDMDSVDGLGAALQAQFPCRGK
jgi:hypothetical protein